MSSSPTPASPLATPGSRLASRAWRFRHSAWMLVPILSLGLVTFVGFAYVGLRAKRAAWWMPAIVYLAASVVSFVVPSETRLDASGQQIDEGWGGGILLATWFAGIVHAFLINRSWLRWRARQSPRAWYSDQHSSASGLVPPPSAGSASPLLASTAAPPANPEASSSGFSTFASGIDDSRTAFVEDAPPARSSMPPASTATGEDAGSQCSSGSGSMGRTTDVNTASAAELADLPDISAEQAELGVAHRRSRGPYQSVAEFAEVIGVKPHELARVQRSLTCVARPAHDASPPRSSAAGRVVDF